MAHSITRRVSRRKSRKSHKSHKSRKTHKPRRISRRVSRKRSFGASNQCSSCRYLFVPGNKYYICPKCRSQFCPKCMLDFYSSDNTNINTIARMNNEGEVSWLCLASGCNALLRREEL